MADLLEIANSGVECGILEVKMSTTGKRKSFLVFPSKSAAEKAASDYADKTKTLFGSWTRRVGKFPDGRESVEYHNKASNTVIKVREGRMMGPGDIRPAKRSRNGSSTCARANE